MQYQFSRYDVIAVLEQHSDNLTYLVSTRDQLKQKAILRIFQKPALLGLAKRDKFFQRLDTLTHLKHPYIVPILDGGIEKGSSYVVSEYMAGGSLRARLDKISPGLLPFEEALTIVIHIGQALDYLHSQQIVHGHLKPKHIFFDGLEQIFLSDIYNPDQLWPVKQEELLSNMYYLAPEQCEETTEASASTPLSDQYTLCCIAYELFTGQTPFTSTDILELKQQQLHEKPADLSRLVIGLPDLINEALLRGLEKNPSQRYPKLSILLTTLQEVSQTTSQPIIPVVTATQPALKVIAEEQAASSASKPTDTTYVDLLASATADDQSASPLSKKSGRKRKLWIGLLLLAIICTLIVYIVYVPHSSAVSVSQSNAHSQADVSPTAVSTQVAYGTKTVMPTSPVVTVHQPLPTVTATPHVKSTSQATSTPTPKVAVIPTATAIAPLFTGQLSTQTGFLSTSSTNLIPQLTVDNVRIEADVTVNGNGGGVAFRSNGSTTSGYRFVVQTSGSYSLMSGSQILSSAASLAIKTGNNVSNHVTIVAVGSQINVSINGQSVVSISNNAYSSGGIGATSSSYGATTSTTCNFSIYAN